MLLSDFTACGILPHALGRLALGLGQDARFADLSGNACHQETGLKVKKFMLCKFAKMSNGYACKKIWTPSDIEQEISSIMQFLWRLAPLYPKAFRGNI